MTIVELIMLPITEERKLLISLLIKLILFIADKLLITHVVLSHPITRTKSKQLAMKTEDIQPHLRKLQIDMIENGNIMD